MTFVVFSEIYSSFGQIKKVQQVSMEFSRHLTAEGISFLHLSLKILKKFIAFFLEDA